MNLLVIAAIIAVAAAAAAGIWFGLRRSGAPRPAARRAQVAAPASRPLGSTGLDFDEVFSGSQESKLDWLIGVGGDVAGREFHVKGGSVTIGRAPSNRIQTTEALASREHCRLTPTGQGLLLEDLGSANGTLVNGQPVRRAVLAYGDRITIGSASWVYEMQSRTTDDADAGAAERVRGAGAHKPTAMATDAAAGDIDQAIADADGDIEEAARRLGVTPQFIQRLLAMRRQKGSS
ncbi:MAG: FHA domain-containing protein [Myxococcota bacterium]